MYYLNKIIGWFTSPFGLLIVGVSIGWWLLRRGTPKMRLAGRIVIGITLGLLWLLSANVTTRLIGVPLEGDECHEINAAAIQACDAVVVLGGGTGVHKQCGEVELFGAADRVWKGARAWKASGNPNMPFIMGGGTGDEMLPLLNDFGIPSSVVKFYANARNTEEEARRIYESGAKRIALVTSAWHMPRARSLFERVGFEVVPVPCDYEMHHMAEYPLTLWDFIPSADCSALCRNSAALKEWVGRFGYWVLRK